MNLTESRIDDSDVLGVRIESECQLTLIPADLAFARRVCGAKSQSSFWFTIGLEWNRSLGG